MPAERAEQGIAAEIALARRISLHAAQGRVSAAKLIVAELPATMAELAAGRTTEARVLTVAREAGALNPDDRAAVDAAIAPRLEGLGDAGVRREVARLAYECDREQFVARTAAAAADRCVSIHPAPDAMVRLSALTPLAQGVAVYAALKKHADTTRGAGDPRTLGQLMADTLVERVTGHAHAGDVPISVGLVMTDQALLGDLATVAARQPAALDSCDAPALLEGGIPIPAALARHLVLAPPPGVPRWIRRLYTSPSTGELVSMDSRARRFTAAQQEFLRARDQVCSVPWCDAPIRDADHLTPAAAGGPTSLDNAAGKCRAHNHAKQAPGWRETLTPPAETGGRREIVIETSTGHTYTSRAPDPPGVLILQRHVRRRRIIKLIWTDPGTAA